MAQDCTLVIKDEVNIQFVGLDVNTRRKLSDSLKFFLPHARHMPSFKLGRWDGTVRFCDLAGRSYLNFIDKLIPIVESSGYYITVQDDRPAFKFEFEEVTETSYSNVVWPKGHPMEGEAISLRDHQVEAINQYLANTQCLQCISTSAGKTIISSALAQRVENYGRTITIVPSKDLVVQTEKDFKNFGLDVGVYFGDRKEPGRTHTICTWQSLEALRKKTKNSEDIDYDLHDLIDGVVAVIVDEAHSIKGDMLKDHLTSTFAHVPIRWGMTGTIPEADHESASLLACIGPVVHSVTAKSLQDKGILSNLSIDILQLQDYHVAHTTYASELKFLVSDKKRLEWMAEHIKQREGNTLVLVDRIEAGQELLSHIPGAVFINGSMKSKDRQEEYSEVTSDSDKTIIATYGVAAVGINVPDIHNLYLIEPGKSFIRVIQSIGRGLRKAKDKDFVNVFDVASTAKYSARHLTKRKSFYKEAQYPYKVNKIDYLSGDK